MQKSWPRDVVVVVEVCCTLAGVQSVLVPPAHQADCVLHQYFETGRIDVSERASREVALDRLERKYDYYDKRVSNIMLIVKIYVVGLRCHQRLKATMEGDDYTKRRSKVPSDRLRGSRIA